MNYTFASATILLILITDPVGNIPIFANALKNVAAERRPWVILREVLIAFVLLLTFMFVGDGFLRVMNLSELSLQIGGGVILFLIALRMIFPPPKSETDEMPGEPLIVPLAIRVSFRSRSLVAPACPEVWTVSLYIALQLRARLFATNHRFAGRSASRRMYQGNQLSP